MNSRTALLVFKYFYLVIFSLFSSMELQKLSLKKDKYQWYWERIEFHFPFFSYCDHKLLD